MLTSIACACTAMLLFVHPAEANDTSLMDAKPNVGTLQSLQGKWKCVAIDEPNADPSDFKLSDYDLEIADSIIQNVPIAIDERGQPFRVDSTKTPMEMDVGIGKRGITIGMGSLSHKWYARFGRTIYANCIFEIEKDMLTICFGDDTRPKEFSTNVDRGGLLVVKYQRVVQKTKNHTTPITPDEERP